MALPLMEPARRNLAYLFAAAGVLWLGVVYVTLSPLVLWPAVVCIISCVLLKLWPKEKFSGAWVTSSALLGFVLSAYQTYQAANHITGAFAFVAPFSLILFLLFAVYHLFLIYAENTGTAEEEEEEK
jgi:predicted membrane protein